MIKKYNLTLLVALAIVITLVSCKKNKIYSIDPETLSESPVSLSEFVGLIPLGATNPPSHTFPTDHMYFFYKDFGISKNIKSPGNLHIFSISRDRHNVGKPDQTEDYSIRFGVQGKSELYFSHIATLSKKLLDAVNNFYKPTSCKIYEVNGSVQERCYKNVSIDVVAGEIIGTGGTVAGQFALDMGMKVNDVAVCPLDYFAPATKTNLEAMLSNSDGSIKRKALPLCGEIYQNIAGTIQGNWYKKGAPEFPEDPHLALIKHEVDPSILLFSIGNGLTGQDPGSYTFLPLNFGQINRPFKDVKADGNVYCYNYKPLNGILIPNASIIVKLENNNELSIEKRNCNCACQPYQFSNNKVAFRRSP